MHPLRLRRLDTTGSDACGEPTQPLQIVPRVLIKVPEVTVYFWIVKLLSTAMGEATSDFLVFQINPYVAVVLGCLGLVGALLLQLMVRRYIAWVYWLAVVMVAVFGTMAADVAHVVLGIPYFVSTAGFAAALACVFVIWQRSEKTLSIHSISRGRREFFYWATVMATFALGTAAGDLIQEHARTGGWCQARLYCVWQRQQRWLAL
jgi:uncharacterized membrane-anchored protein